MDDAMLPAAPASLEEIAEDARAWSIAAQGPAWHRQADVVLHDEPVSDIYWYHGVYRVRFSAGDADRRIADVRAWFRARGRPEWAWVVGSSATPRDLLERLLATGGVREGHGPTEVMVLEHEPPPTPRGIVVRQVATAADRAAFDAIQAAAFGRPPDQVAELAATRDARWDAFDADRNVAFLAFLDGGPAATGGAVPLVGGGSMLFGGSTHPDARGRGLYRAVVRARWDWTVAAGGRGLVVDANAESAPILASLGFRKVSTLERVIDRAPPARGFGIDMADNPVHR